MAIYLFFLQAGILPFNKKLKNKQIYALPDTVDFVYESALFYYLLGVRTGILKTQSRQNLRTPICGI